MNLIKRLLKINYWDILRGNLEYNVISKFKTVSPKQLQLNITYRCNSKCIMCNIWRWGKEKKEISLSGFEKILSNDIFRGIRTLGIAGGEPFLRKDITELFDLCLNKMPRLYSVGIVTNGMLTSKIISETAKIADMCTGKGVKLGITVSVDGIGKIHDEMRGIPGLFEIVEKTLEGLTKLKESKNLSIFIASVMTKKNVLGMQELANWALSKFNIPLSYQIVGFHETYVNNLDTVSELDFTAKEYGILLDTLKMLANPKNLYDLSAFYWDEIFELYRDKRQRGLICPMIVDTFVVDCYGDVYLCLSENKIGNIFENGSINEIYYGKKSVDHRKYLKRQKCPTCNSGCFYYKSVRNNIFKYLMFYLKKRLKVPNQTAKNS